MMYAQLTRAQNEVLDVVRILAARGCAPSGFPAVLPMWRVVDGVEAEDETDELCAMRQALARLAASDSDAYQLVTQLATGRAVARSYDWMAAAAALDDLDAAVEEALRG